MYKKFEKLINMCKEGIELTNDNIGDGMFLVDRETFQLIIPSNNTEEHGYFLVNSIKGHDCYSYNSESNHIYHVIEGTGKFVIDDETIEVKPGDIITIEPKKIFAYMGKMILILEMLPNYKEENDFFVKKVIY